MPAGFRTRFRTAVAGLTPGYFALLMATGIISVGLHLEGSDLLSRALLVVCAVAFVVLLAYLPKRRKLSAAFQTTLPATATISIKPKPAE